MTSLSSRCLGFLSVAVPSNSANKDQNLFMHRKGFIFDFWVGSAIVLWLSMIQNWISYGQSFLCVASSTNLCLSWINLLSMLAVCMNLMYGHDKKCSRNIILQKEFYSTLLLCVSFVLFSWNHLSKGVTTSSCISMFIYISDERFVTGSISLDSLTTRIIYKHLYMIQSTVFSKWNIGKCTGHSIVDSEINILYP